MLCGQCDLPLLRQERARMGRPQFGDSKVGHPPPAEQIAEKLLGMRGSMTSAAEAGTEDNTVYRSGEPLRHPKARTNGGFFSKP